MGNSLLEKSSVLIKKPFFSDYRTLLGLWLILGIVSALAKMHSHNNFMIFKGVFWHVWNQTSLFIEYPQEYFDVNHYGPLFSLVIAPFAVVPDQYSNSGHYTVSLLLNRKGEGYGSGLLHCSWHAGKTLWNPGTGILLLFET